MKIFNLTRKFAFLAVFAAVALIMVPKTTMATSSNTTLPGSGCEDLIDIEWLYEPPAFIGEVRVFLNPGGGGELEISTPNNPLVQYGRGNCTITLVDFPLGTILIEEEPINEEQFSNLKPSDMHGFCQPNNFGIIKCNGDDLFPFPPKIELISIGNMSYGQEINGEERVYFDAQAVMMPLRVKGPGGP